MAGADENGLMGQWYCQLEHGTSGPFNFDDLGFLKSRGTLKPDHLIRQGTDGEWVSAGSIEDLFPTPRRRPAVPQGKVGQEGDRCRPDAGLTHSTSCCPCTLM
jgi:hypothetical protein